MMNKSLQRLALLCALASGSAFATEMRTPWISQNGPLRYTFEKLHKDKSNFNWWSAAHAKEAHKAFLKHGIKSQPLTALIFNQADFQMNQIFPNSQVPFGVEEYSPFLRLYKLSPRVSYTEAGMTVGARWDCPVWKNKGRVGVRASVPFRRIEWEREDDTDKNEDPAKQFIATKLIRIDRNSPNASVNVGKNAGDPGSSDGSFEAFGAATPNLSDSVNKLASFAGVTDSGVQAALLNLANQTTTGAINTAIVGAGLIDAGNSLGQSQTSEIQNLVNLTSQTGKSVDAIKTVDTLDLTLEQALGTMLAGPKQGGREAAMTNDSTVDKGIVLAAKIDSAIAAVREAAARGNRAASNNQPDVVCNAYRLDFVQALQNSQEQSALQFPATDGKVVNVFGNNIAVSVGTSGTVPGFQKNRATVALARATDREALETEGFVAWMPASNTNPDEAHVNISNIVTMEQTLATPLAKNQVAVFDDRGTSGAGFNYNSIYKTGTTDFTDSAAQQAQQLWMVFRRAADSNDAERFSRNPTGNVGEGGTIARTIEDIRRQYNENPLVFLARKGFDFDTRIRSGLGDVDLDLFYEHAFNPDWMGELCVGVRFPTAGNKDKYGTPYSPIKGNGDHFEIKLGALLAFQPWNCMNFKIDAAYSFVLEATEQRMAAFKGATIKNIGPRADADVDWGYFVGHFDMTFFHPKTNAVRSMLGYEFYYKTEDRVNFKVSKMQSWLGGIFVNNELKDNPMPLDNNAARKNTESIAHKIRTETSVQINPYFEFFVGGSVTFAGQNVMRDRDYHAGFNVRF